MNVPKRPMIDPCVYTGTLGEIVDAVSPHSEGDPVGILVSLLAAYSCEIGKKYRVRVDHSTHPLVIWPLMVGRTSVGKKGTASGVALKIWADAFPDEFDLQLIEETPKSGASLAQILADQDENEIHKSLIYTEEFAGVMRAASMDDKLGGHLRLIWQGGNLRHNTTKMRVSLNHPHVAFISHVTPGELQAKLRKGDLAGGTYNRFLVTYVERSKKLPFGGDMTDSDWSYVAKLFRKMTPSSYMDGVTFRVNGNSAAGRYYEDHIYPLADTAAPGSILEEFSARLAPYALRLAALYALSAGRKDFALSDMKAAEALVKYMLESVEYVMRGYEPATDGGGKTREPIRINLGGDATKAIPDDIRKIKNVLMQRGEVTSQELQALTRVPKFRIPDAVAALGDSVSVEKRPTGGRGQPPIIYMWEGESAPQEAPEGSTEPAAKRREVVTHTITAETPKKSPATTTSTAAERNRYLKEKLGLS